MSSSNKQCNHNDNNTTTIQQQQEYNKNNTQEQQRQRQRQQEQHENNYDNNNNTARTCHPMEMVECTLRALSAVVVVQVTIQLMIAAAEEDVAEVMVRDDTEVVVANNDVDGMVNDSKDDMMD